MIGWLKWILFDVYTEYLLSLDVTMRKDSKTQLQTLLVGDKTMQVSIVRSVSRKRTITLKIANENLLILRAPMRASARSLQDFLQNQMFWILKKLTCVAKIQAPLALVNGAMLPFLGENYSLNIIETGKGTLGC